MKWITLCLLWSTISAQEDEASLKLDVIINVPSVGYRPKWTVAKLVIETRTETVRTSIYSERVDTSICAKTVNVTGVCIQRRGRWIEQPSVLTFDEDMDAADQLLMPNPVQSVGLEFSAAAQLPESTVSSSTAASNIRTSMERQDEWRSMSRKWIDVIKDVWKEHPWKLATLTKLTSTKIVMITETVSFVSFSVTYKTIFIQGCTPNPFPFPICPSRR